MGDANWKASFDYCITVETAYKVAVSSRGNLLYKRIYLIADLKLLCRGELGLKSTL